MKKEIKNRVIIEDYEYSYEKFDGKLNLLKCIKIGN